MQCDEVIEAPDDQRGHEVVCPSCEATNVLQSEEDTQRLAEEEVVQREQERQQFLSALGSGERPGHLEPSRPTLETAGWRAPIELSSSNMALFASRKLREVSLYLLVFAYGLPILALIIAVVVALWGGLPGVWSVVAFLGGGLVGVMAYLYFKFMSDVVRALADVSDLARSMDARLVRLTELHTSQEDGAGEPTDRPHVLRAG